MQTFIKNSKGTGYENIYENVFYFSNFGIKFYPMVAMFNKTQTGHFSCLLVLYERGPVWGKVNMLYFELYWKSVDCILLHTGRNLVLWNAYITFQPTQDITLIRIQGQINITDPQRLKKRVWHSQVGDVKTLISRFHNRAATFTWSDIKANTLYL